MEGGAGDGCGRTLVKGKSIDQHVIVTKEEKGKTGRGEVGRRLRVVGVGLQYGLLFRAVTI